MSLPVELDDESSVIARRRRLGLRECRGTFGQIYVLVSAILVRPILDWNESNVRRRWDEDTTR